MKDDGNLRIEQKVQDAKYMNENYENQNFINEKDVKLKLDII